MPLVIQPAIHFAHFSMTDPFRLQVGQTLAVADAIRQILLGIEGAHTDGGVDFTFSGHSQDGDNQGDHQHAYLMPLDTTGDGHLDQVLIRAPLGFSIQNLVALEAIQAEVEEAFLRPGAAFEGVDERVIARIRARFRAPILVGGGAQATGVSSFRTMPTGPAC